MGYSNMSGISRDRPDVATDSPAVVPASPSSGATIATHVAPELIDTNYRVITYRTNN